jgi:hypothetical protein
LALTYHLEENEAKRNVSNCISREYAGDTEKDKKEFITLIALNPLGKNRVIFIFR